MTTHYCFHMFVVVWVAMMALYLLDMSAVWAASLYCVLTDYLLIHNLRRLTTSPVKSNLLYVCCVQAC